MEAILFFERPIGVAPIERKRLCKALLALGFEIDLLETEGPRWPKGHLAIYYELPEERELVAKYWKKIQRLARVHGFRPHPGNWVPSEVWGRNPGYPWGSDTYSCWKPKGRFE